MYILRKIDYFKVSTFKIPKSKNNKLILNLQF